MATTILDYVTSFVVLLGLLTFSITTATQVLNNVYTYHQAEQINLKSTDFLNNLLSNTGSPSTWGQTSTTPTNFGVRWPITMSKDPSPFTPMRFMTSGSTQPYGLFEYFKLSTANMNLNIKQSDYLNYDTASDLMNTRDLYGWRLTYSPLVDMEITPQAASTVTWYPNWGNRHQITIDHNQIPSMLTDQPTLISITGDVGLKNHTQPDGDDILFTDSDQLSKLYHEIEFYDSSTGTLRAWVRLPQLSDTQDTVLYIYYGNIAATNQQNPSGVWGSNYKYVTHMYDNPDNRHIDDSTSSGLTGTKKAMNEPAQTNGLISFAQDFDGVGDYVQIQTTALSGDSLVLDMWLKSVNSSKTQAILSEGAKYNDLGFIDLSRPASSNDLMFDYAANSTWIISSAGLSDGILINCLTYYNGKIYGGSSDGRLFEWNGASAWVEKAAQLGGQTEILSLAYYNSKLYGGTSPGGRLFEWDGVSSWIQRADQLGLETSINTLTVFDPGSGNKLYGGTSPGGKLYEWDSINFRWIQRAPTLKILSLALFNGKIYGGTSDGRLFEWDSVNQIWLEAAPKMGAETYINALIIYDDGTGNAIYAGTSPNGKLYRWDLIARVWLQVADRGALGIIDVTSMTVFNGKIYAGTNPGGLLCSWTPPQLSWTQEKVATGETSLISLTTSAIPNVSNYNFNGNSGGWTNGGFAVTSNNQYSSHTPVSVLTLSPTQNNGAWNNPTRAYSDDTQYASTSTSGAQHRYYGYVFAPTSVTIESVRVRFDAYASGTSPAQSITLTVSSNNGASWLSNSYTTSTLPTSQNTYWVDVTSWDTWTPSKINSLRTRVTKNGSTRTVYLDWIPIEVTYSTSPASHTFSTFNVPLSGNPISKVEVGIEGYTNVNERLSINVTWDGGSTWAPAQIYNLPSVDPNSLSYLDFTSATTWTFDKLSNANFQVKVTDVYNGAASSSYIDYLCVRITTLGETTLFASSSPNTYLYTLTQANVWTKVITSKYGTDNSVLSIISHGGNIYGSASPSGHLIKWDGGISWVKSADPPGTQKPITLLSNGATLYGGTTPNGYLYSFNGASWTPIITTQYSAVTSVLSLIFDSGNNLRAGTDDKGFLLGVGGSSWIKNADFPLLSESKICSLTPFNSGTGIKLYGATYPSGYLYEWDGVGSWAIKANTLNNQTSVNALSVFNNKLYGGTSPDSLLFEWNNVGSWIEKAAKLENQNDINTLAVFNSNLYAGTASSGLLFEWNGVDSWVKRASSDTQYSITSLVVNTGLNKLFGSAAPDGVLYEWNELSAWIQRTNFLGIHSMAEYNGLIYCGTAQTGSLYVWNATTSRWVQKAGILGSETDILSLGVFNGKLYGGTSPGGRLYEWNGAGSWVQKAPQLNSQTAINDLIVFNGKLYGGTGASVNGGRLFEWDGSGVWIQRTNTLNSQNSIQALVEFNGKIYGGTSSGGRLFEWNGVNAWVERAPQLNSQTNINDITIYNGKLYGCTSPNGSLFEWNGLDAWLQKCYQLDTEITVSRLIVYNSKLYGSTSPNALLYEWDGSNSWVNKASTVSSQSTVSSLTIFNGALYGVTKPSGLLLKFSDEGDRMIDNFFQGFDNTWVHLSIHADYTLKQIKFYRNGFIYDALNPASIVKPSSTPRFIGGYSISTKHYDGLIDELKIGQFTDNPSRVLFEYRNQVNPSNIYSIYDEESMKFPVEVKVFTKTGPLSFSTLDATLIYSIPTGTYPLYEQVPSVTTYTNDKGEALIEFPGFTPPTDAYIILVRSRNVGFYGIGYHIVTSGSDPYGAFITDYNNGAISLVHENDTGGSYTGDIYYNATYILPIGESSYRYVKLGSPTGILSPSNPAQINLSAVKDASGVLLVFYNMNGTRHGISVTPWGISALGCSVTYGETIVNTQKLVIKTQTVNIDKNTYEIKLEFWQKGG